MSNTARKRPSNDFLQSPNDDPRSPNTGHGDDKPQYAEQFSGSYYYDDAHGYKEYDPDSDEDIDEESDSDNQGK